MAREASKAKKVKKAKGVSRGSKVHRSSVFVEYESGLPLLWAERLAAKLRRGGLYRAVKVYRGGASGSGVARAAVWVDEPSHIAARASRGPGGVCSPHEPGSRRLYPVRLPGGSDCGFGKAQSVKAANGWGVA